MILYFDFASPMYESLTSTKSFLGREGIGDGGMEKNLSPGASSAAERVK